MPSCIRLEQTAKLTSWLLVLLISACSQNPTKPVQMTTTPTLHDPQEQHSSQNLGLTLSSAYTMMQAKTPTNDISSPSSSLFDFYQIQNQLAPHLSVFFKEQNSALALVETYWELAIVNTALEQIWLEQEKLIPAPSAQSLDQNLVAPVSYTQLAQQQALAFSHAQLTQRRDQIRLQLAQLIGSNQTDISLNYLPLSELRLRFPEPNTLLINEFAKALLKQNYHSTYTRLTSNHPKLKSLQIQKLFQQPILGTYVWYEIQSQLNHQASLIPTNTPKPQLARELHLIELNVALVHYNYSHQKMRTVKGQYKAAQSLYQLSLEQRLAGNINQQEVNSRSIEAMAIHLTYLQATLDTVHAYSKLLASSHLPPNTWQQSLERLSLANKDFAAISNIINLSPGSGTEEPLENSDHLVSITGYNNNATDTSDQINHLALLHHLEKSQHLKHPHQRTTISTVAQAYLWQIDLGIDKNVETTQALLEQEPELAYLLHHHPTSTSPGSHTLTAIGLGHSQARVLCERLKQLKSECWLQQSEY